MAMRSERINLLVTPDEKGLIEDRARIAGLSTNELIRRAVGAYDAETDMDALQALVDALGQAADRIEAKLTATLQKVDRLEQALADRDGLRAQARAELEATGAVWPFGQAQDEAALTGSP